jgi:hypothetical protein
VADHGRAFDPQLGQDLRHPLSLVLNRVAVGGLLRSPVTEEVDRDHAVIPVE